MNRRTLLLTTASAALLSTMPLPAFALQSTPALKTDVDMVLEIARDWEMDERDTARLFDLSSHLVEQLGGMEEAAYYITRLGSSDTDERIKSVLTIYHYLPHSATSQLLWLDGATHIQTGHYGTPRNMLRNGSVLDFIYLATCSRVLNAIN